MVAIEENPGYQMLYYYISNGDDDAVSQLIMKYADILKLDEKAMLLRLALRGWGVKQTRDELETGYLNIVEILISDDTYTNYLMSKVKCGLTVLHEAVAVSCFECIKIISNKGISIFSADKFLNAQDDFGNTPLFLTEYRKAIIEKTLFGMALKGATDITENGILTKMEARAISKMSKEAVDDIEKIKNLLLQSGANPIITNKWNQTASLWADMQASLVSGKIDKLRKGTERGDIFYWPPLYHPIIPPPKRIADTEDLKLSPL